MSIQHPWKRLLPISLLILTTACGPIRLPRIVFEDVPTPTPELQFPTPTPLPATTVTFAAHIPGTTPSGSAPAVSVIDEVGGKNTTVILTHSGGNVWTGQYPTALGAVLRYKYIRPLPTYVEEATAARQPIAYRLLHVTGAGLIADDIVATWADAPFSGDVGNLTGILYNSNTGKGVMGILVSAGGKTTLTAWDGSYTLFDLPAGSQRVTTLAPDGALRPAQGTVALSKSQTAILDLAAPDPNGVHVTFLVRPPPGTDPNAVMRVAGNVSQMGDTFVPDVGGSAIAAARQPVFFPLADGRWTTTLVLYEGTHLRYKYTLGDGVWDGELRSDGSPRLRELIVPLTDVLVLDTIESWHTGTAAQVLFEVTTPANTPANDVISIQFRLDVWRAPVPMWRVGPNQWKFMLYNPTSFSGSIFYRYCRNFACGSADDVDTAGNGASGRFFTPTLFPQDLKDSLAGWQWLGNAASSPVALPPITGRVNFVAGVDFADDWRANALPSILDTLKGLPGFGANWVTFARRGLAQQINPVPAYADDPALAPLLPDWKAVVDQAHGAGLRVALHPVTCHYTPYGACDYWNSAPYSPEFWSLWFAAYEKYLLTQADLAARTATDLLVIGDFKLRPALPGEPEAPPDADARWRSLIAKVRQRYGGQLGFEFLMSSSGVWPNTPAFLDSVDVIRFFWWSALADRPAPAVAEMAAVAGSLMDVHLLPILQGFNKPIMLNAAYSSVDGAATQCIRDAANNCRSFEDFNPDRPDLAQYALDLNEQADAYTAMLTALNSRGWIAGFSTYGYNPAATLRDKSISVRGKPAEGVLAAWYPKLQGK
jgi:hypothetical protein